MCCGAKQIGRLTYLALDGTLHEFDALDWSHEPTPNPSQEGNGQDADEIVLPSWEGSGVGWFMESESCFPNPDLIPVARLGNPSRRRHDG